MNRGGRTKPVPRGRAMARVGRRMPGGGMSCGGMNQPPCPGNGYRRGGKFKRVFNKGGRLTTTSGLPPRHSCTASQMLRADGTCVNIVQ